MNILHIGETYSGCYKIRSQIPAKYLRNLGHTVCESNSDTFDGFDKYDIAIFYRGFITDIVTLTDFVHHLKSLDIKIVFDTDDAIDKVHPNSPAYEASRSMLASMRILANEADLITVSTPELACLFSSYSNVKVLHNCIDPDDWKARPENSDRLRIGYSCGCTHLDDIFIILDAVRDLQKKHDFTFILHGIHDYKNFDDYYTWNSNIYGSAFQSNPINEKIRRIGESLKYIDYEFHPSVPIEQYPYVLSNLNLDIGLCPLHDTDFNRHKSCVKYYEYSMCNTVTLASNVIPYNTELVYLAKNKYIDWYNKLEKLIVNADFRNSLLADQKLWVLDNRNISTYILNYEREFINLLQSVPRGSMEKACQS